MSQKQGLSSPPRADAPASGRKKRLLPQIPVQSSRATLSTSVARGNETTINLTTVSELSTVSTLSQSGSQLDGSHHAREFVSPVRFTNDGEDSCVTVAVRVRPFSQRELDLQQAKPIIRMHGNEVIIKSHSEVVHRFYYDHCFWSLPETPPGEGWGGKRDLSPIFATQEYVYQQLAQPLLDRSFEGYNTCLFAYGQTGSGKSYCIMGEGEAIGIVPRFAQELFERVEGTADEETSFKVQVSYYEIYKEKIYDLLASTQNKVKKKLRVREHPVLGPYVEDLSTFVADSYSDIERWINLGNRYRATAATGMNERSSRSHSVFTITLTQTMVFEGEDQSKVSRINLIDLAGSERSSVSKTSGERLKEGASINKSLHSLGKVISLLSEKGSGRRKKVFIPYRDSTLTWLLKESLGGNSKTAMIATVSPSHLHYDESLSTLRYAQQARTIVNVARVNEDPNAAIIRDLRQQIEELKSMLQSSTLGQLNSDPSELRSLNEKLLESEKLMAETTRSWQEKLRQSEARKQEEMEQLKRSGALIVDNRQPNLVNLTEDPQLSEIVVYFLKEGVTRIGGRSEAGSHDIELSGALVMADHCSISNECGRVTLHPSPNTEAQTYLNGELMSVSTQLHHGDRIVLGMEYFFRFNHPLEVEQGSVHLKKGQGTFEYAKNELIRVQTARLEAELEERRLKEREAMMAELQLMKDAAQKDMDHQKEEYEGKMEEYKDKMARLARELAEQSMEASHHLRSSEEAQARMEELLERNKALEEETMTQKHLIHLERLKAEREYEEIKEEKTRLMSDLEQERNKLVSDIQQLNKNKVLRTTANRRESTISNVPSEPSMRGSEMVRLAMMLQEASAISKSFNKPLTFSREEFANDSGSLEVQVRVNNTQEGLVTFWSLDKFESRLELMKDIYNSSTVSGVEGSSTSLEGEGSSAEDSDPFSDPADSWMKESLITPHPSPMRASSVRSLLMSNSSTHSTSTHPTIAQPQRSLLDMFNSSFISSRGGSPAVPPRRDPALLPSLPTLCHQRINDMLHIGEGVVPCPRSTLQTVLTHVLAVRDCSDAIEETLTLQCSQTESDATPTISKSVLTLYTSLELLLAAGQALHRELLILQGLLARLLPDYTSRGLVKERGEELLETISHQTALYCSRLLQAIDKETDNGVKDACVSLRESLDSLTQQIGSLSLGRQVMSKILHSRLGSTTSPSSDGVEWAVEDDFLTLQPYLKSATLFYQGYGEWCALSLEHTHQKVKEHLDLLSEQDGTSESKEIVSGVLKELEAVEAFLQKLAQMQTDVWSVSCPGDGTLPLTPPLPSTLDLLAHLQQVEKAVDSIATHTCTLTPAHPHTNLDGLSASNKQVAYCCNELAALTLRVISGSPNPLAQGYVSDIQQLSHEIARAGKTVNHIIKRGGGKERVKKKSSEKRLVEREDVQTVAPDTPPGVTPCVGVMCTSTPSVPPKTFDTTTTPDTPNITSAGVPPSIATSDVPPSTSVTTNFSTPPSILTSGAPPTTPSMPSSSSVTTSSGVSADVAVTTVSSVPPFVEDTGNSATINESRTSMATGQLTQSPEHVAVKSCLEPVVVKSHVTSKEDHMTIVPDVYSNYDDDSTLI